MPTSSITAGTTIFTQIAAPLITNINALNNIMIAASFFARLGTAR